jgi:hypothetical protein
MKYYSRKASCHGGHCFYYMVKSSKFLINKYEDYEEKLKNKMCLGMKISAKFY